MTSDSFSALRRTTLTGRLQALSAERERARREAAPQFAGDDADRATNVEAHVRAAQLDNRIAALEVRLRLPLRAPGTAGTVAEGSLITLDFGDGPERFYFAAVDDCPDGYSAVTPNSPLGQALLGARANSTIDYTADRRLQRVVLVDVASAPG